MDLADKTTDINKLRAEIGFVFQQFNLYPHLSVISNITLAPMKLRGLSRKDAEEQAMQLLTRVGLAEKRQWLAGALSHGQKQWLEIGMLLIQGPDLLLVDEPAAGMTDHETALTAKLLREISGERSVVVVEHDMEFIKALDCPVTVLHEGRVLAEGTLEKVQNNEEVIEVYLGR